MQRTRCSCVVGAGRFQLSQTGRAVDTNPQCCCLHSTRHADMSLALMGPARGAAGLWQRADRHEGAVGSATGAALPGAFCIARERSAAVAVSASRPYPRSKAVETATIQLGTGCKGRADSAAHHSAARAEGGAVPGRIAADFERRPDSAAGADAKRRFIARPVVWVGWRCRYGNQRGRHVAFARMVRRDNTAPLSSYIARALAAECRDARVATLATRAPCRPSRPARRSK